MPARFNRSIRPVNSIKHVVDAVSTAVPAGAVSTLNLIQAVDAPTLASTTTVNQGSTVNSIYLRVEVEHVSGQPILQNRIYMAIMKNPGNNLSPVFPANVGSNDNKKFVIHQEMIMVTQNSADAGSFPRTMFQGVIKIPRGYRRNGTNDRLNALFSLDVAETVGAVDVCVQCIYKEYF